MVFYFKTAVAVFSGLFFCGNLYGQTEYLYSMEKNTDFRATFIQDFDKSVTSQAVSRVAASKRLCWRMPRRDMRSIPAIASIPIFRKNFMFPACSREKGLSPSGSLYTIGKGKFTGSPKLRGHIHPISPLTPTNGRKNLSFFVLPRKMSGKSPVS